MAKKFEYTTRAYRYTARYPRLTYVGTQINFWIVANLLLVSIMQLQSLMISETFRVHVAGDFWPLMVIGIILGVGYGIILGFTNYYLDQNFFRKLPLGKIIVFKALSSVVVLMLILMLFRYVLYESLILETLPPHADIAQDESWNSIFWLLLLYYSFMSLMLSFINQVNKKYGPGVLIPLLLGRYRSPQEEERIFLFMDLKSSVTIAEKLGHLQYSAFIRDCFADINEMLYPFCAQVYQYVGDEVVVTWSEEEGLKNHFCIRFYFACQQQFKTRSDYYMKNYGLLPDFKAGIHTGMVTTVEIGEVKRDLAYHGDALNIAARIQSVCNTYNKSFLASKDLIHKLGTHPGMETEELGKILLKGKTSEIELVAVNGISN